MRELMLEGSANEDDEMADPSSHPDVEISADGTRYVYLDDDDEGSVVL